MPLKTHRPSRPSRGSICIYGKAGYGKTTLIGTMPGKGLIVDTSITEGGEQVLADKADRIEVFTCTTYDQVDEVFTELEQGRHQCDWVCMDSATGMVALAQHAITGEYKISDRRRITLQERGDINGLVGELFYRFNTLPQWILWTAQERIHGNGENDPGPAMIGPGVPPGLLLALTPPMMILGHLELQANDEGGFDRVLRVGENDTVMAKVRNIPGRRPPALIAKPHLGKLLKYLLSDDPEVVRKNKPKAAEDFTIAM